MELRWTETHEQLLEDLSLHGLIAIMRKGSLWELLVRGAENKAWSKNEQEV